MKSVKESLLERGSIRRYERQPIEPEKLDFIYEAIRNAPTSLMKELHYGRRDAVAYLILLLFVGGLYASRYLPAVSQLLHMIL